jgi:hypothetical protein
LRLRTRLGEPHAAIGFLEDDIVGHAVGSRGIKIDNANCLARAKMNEKIIALSFQIQDIGAAHLEPHDTSRVDIYRVEGNGTGFAS